MAAPARSRPAPIFVLRDVVDTGNFTDEPGHGWTKIECASKKAYGCGEHDQEAVQGLKLYVRLGEEPLVTSSLAIRMSDEALQRFDSQLELGCPPRLKGLRRHMTSVCLVQMADEQDLTVILVVFRRDYRPELAYYLVYDHTCASLSMINYLPDLCGSVATMKPVAKRRGSDFELFLMASQSSPFDALCVCTPETRANPASQGPGPWKINRMCFQHEEEIQEPFEADVAFSWQGKGFWADLSQGLVYCDLHSDSSGVGDVGFIRLPPESRRLGSQMEMEVEMEEEMDMPMKVTRTMGCVRDSIWFVRIDRATEYADDLVKMWTLKLPQGNLKQARWEMVKEVTVSKLWGLDSFKVARLPEGPLEFPVLTPHGDLSVMLADQREETRELDDICVFDMNLKRLRWHGFVHEYYFTDQVIFPSNSLPRKHGSRKRTVDDGHRPAAGLAALAGSKQWVN